MDFVDAFLPLGRTNLADPRSPVSQEEALALMDRYRVSEALVYHVIGRDADPELGARELETIDSPRLHRIWCFDSAVTNAESPDAFLRRALDAGVRAVMFNPLARNIRPTRAPRLLELAGLLEARRIPLLMAWRQWDKGQDTIDWYEMAEFSRKFPSLPVIAWEMRSRANRPLYDALAEAPQLRVSLSCLWQAQIVEEVVENFGAGRLVFSLGLPTLNPGAFHGVVTYADLPEGDKALIAAGNIRAMMQEADYE